MFYISYPLLPNTLSSGASKLHDSTRNMKLVRIKDKEKLNRIKKKSTYYTCYIIVFSKFFSILSLRKGHFCLLLVVTAIITVWDGEKQEKPGRTNLILIRKTEMNKVLIMVCPLKPQDFSGAMTTTLLLSTQFFHRY